MADIVLINPRFEISYWGMENTLPYLGKRANLPVACLPLLAALTPPGHSVTLVDENVEAIDYDRCVRADIVGVTGMVVQKRRGIRRRLIVLSSAAGASVDLALGLWRSESGKRWMIPLAVFLCLFGLILIVATTVEALAPFIYAIF